VRYQVSLVSFVIEVSFGLGECLNVGIRRDLLGING